MAYQYQPYPKALHRPDGSQIVVQNEIERDVRLAEGWYLQPAPQPVPAADFAGPAREWVSTAV